MSLRIVFFYKYNNLICILLLMIVCSCIDSNTCEQSQICNDIEKKASFPMQLSCHIRIMSHLLENGLTDEYPPRERHMDLVYDYPNRRARIDLEEGFEASKFYIRRYDLQSEFMIRLPPISDCKRAYLGTLMPPPLIPLDHVFVGKVQLNEITVDYYLLEEMYSRFHMYFKEDSNIPVQLVHESMELDGSSVPLLTYDYSNITLSEPPESIFELPEEYSSDNKTKCVLHSAGFPYIHVFHYFVKL